MLVTPDELIIAAQRLAIVESDISAADLAAAASTSRVPAPGRDEVSEGIAGLLSSYGQSFHAAIEQTGVLSAQQLTRGLTSAASSYASAEASNITSLIQGQIDAILTQVEVDAGLALLIPILIPFAIGLVIFYAGFVIFNGLTGNTPVWGY